MLAPLGDSRVLGTAHTVVYVAGFIHKGDADGVNTSADACQQVDDENNQERLDESQAA